MCFYHESNMMGQESGGCPPFFSSISTLLRNQQYIKQSNCSVQTGALIVATTDEAVVTSAFRDFQSATRSLQITKILLKNTTHTMHLQQTNIQTMPLKFSENLTIPKKPVANV